MLDRLPSWNDGPAKSAIEKFVQATTDPASPDFVPEDERIATFDQDGTLWVEHPIVTQLAFAFARVAALASANPKWKDEEPFKSVLAGDKAAIAKLTMQGFETILMATHAGMETGEFHATVSDWVAKAKDPSWNRSYTELVYQPMLEVMQYLRANGFKIYIVTGGGQAFVRTFAQQRLRDSARTRHRLGRQNELFVYQRRPRRTRKAAARCSSSTTRPRSPKTSICFSDGGPARLLGIRTAIGKCSSIRKETSGPTLDDARPARRRRARVCVRPGTRVTGRKTQSFLTSDVRRSNGQRVVRHQHEERLETTLRFRALGSRAGVTRLLCSGSRDAPSPYRSFAANARRDEIVSNSWARRGTIRP